MRKKKMKAPATRKPLSPESKERRIWNRIYVEAKKRVPNTQMCSKCGHLRHKDNMEPHHPFGRHKERIMAFLWLCHPCHQIIHDEGKQSRQIGWLQPEFDGTPVLLERRIPWPMAHEANWPETLRFSKPCE